MSAANKRERRQQIFNALAFSALSAALVAASGCGSKAYREGSVSGGSSGTVGGGSSGGGTYVPPTPTPTTTVTPTACSGIPAAVYSFTLAGNGTTGTTPSTVTINVGRTDNLLKIKVKAGPSGNLSLPSGQYSNAAFALSAAAYTITVNGRSQATNGIMLDGDPGYPYGPPIQQHSQPLDFSDRVSVGSAQDYSVTVSNPRYDLYCKYLLAGLINPSYYATYCSAGLYSVYRTHVMSGSIEVQTNGTCMSAD